ncbi:hypothetical protein CBR_g603 [Chara braunii]|uniref:HNH nuclease domain-containing protein n=1 Tax=Chara braunii TaxID=69332 RepID=A0A388KBN1_CHABU|nr:hypothetical protein CBR_g603 [Chara braunii]|eukprot:GBG67468.1 hypothetical protein CBR_g603 [Chara braunii]
MSPVSEKIWWWKRTTCERKVCRSNLTRRHSRRRSQGSDERRRTVLMRSKSVVGHDGDNCLVGSCYHHHHQQQQCQSSILWLLTSACNHTYGIGRGSDRCVLSKSNSCVPSWHLAERMASPRVRGHLPAAAKPSRGIGEAGAHGIDSAHELESEARSELEQDGDEEEEGEADVCFGIYAYDMDREDHLDDYDDLTGYRGLVLDVSYNSTTSSLWTSPHYTTLWMHLDAFWTRYLRDVGLADVLHYYDQFIKSPNASFPLPAVLKVNRFVAPKASRRKIKPIASRSNILLRDQYKCQYCGARENLTIDHVLATSRGGKWSWENLVTACQRCNTRKGDKTPAEAGMKLQKQPMEPKILEFPPSTKAYRSIRVEAKTTPREWLDYLRKLPK